MFRSTTSFWIAVGAAAALLVGAGVVVAQDAGAGGASRRRPGHRGRAALLRRAHLRRAHARRALERLDALTDAQARAALDAARDLARIREEVRGRAAALVLQAFRDAKAASPEDRRAIREATREKLKALRAEFRGPFTDAGMKVVRTLTPDQRARIGEAAKARGRTVDDAALARWFGLRLSHPWAEALLKAKTAE